MLRLGTISQRQTAFLIHSSSRVSRPYIYRPCSSNQTSARAIIPLNPASIVNTKPTSPSQHQQRSFSHKLPQPHTPVKMPTEVQSTQELQTLFDNNQFVVLDFHASWCPPCKAIAPLYVKLAGEHGVTGGLAFAKVNVDDVPEVAKKYSVTAMPTFMFFKNGQPVAVDVPVNSSGAQKGPNGIDLIKGADPRALTACVAKLGELAKASGGTKAAATSNGAADGFADKKAVAGTAPDLTTKTQRNKLERRAEKERGDEDAIRLRKEEDAGLKEYKKTEKRLSQDQHDLKKLDEDIAKLEDKRQKAETHKKIAKIDEKMDKLAEKRRSLSGSSGH